MEAGHQAAFEEEAAERQPKPIKREKANLTAKGSRENSGSIWARFARGQLCERGLHPNDWDGEKAQGVSQGAEGCVLSWVPLGHEVRHQGVHEAAQHAAAHGCQQQKQGVAIKN